MTAPGARARVFISYARRDGEALARSLRERLLAAGVPLWRDREGMEGGRDWWQQITAAIDEVEFLVLVMTDAALGSQMVRREWRYARQRGVAVYPVLADPRLDFAALPRWMRSVHFYDLEKEWTKFLNDLQTQPSRVRVPFMVEDQPADFVRRPHEYERLAAHLLDREREEPIAVTAVLCGAGGYGKTALVRALCHDEAVQNAFDDGILWVTLGASPGDLTGRVEDLILMLSGQRPGYSAVEAATAALVELLADRDVLIVIDDVWDASHVAPFLQGGPRCARVITTRVADVVPSGARRIDVDAMRAEEAVALVGHGLPAGGESELGALATRLGEWPLLLKLVNSALRERVLHKNQALGEALAWVHKALDKRGLTFFDAQNAVSRHNAVAKTLGLSIAQLSDAEQARFEELAVFPEDVAIPLDTLASYWGRTGGLDDFDSETLCDRLSRLSLVLLFDPTERFIRMHDVVRQFLLTGLADRLAGLHAALLASARPEGGAWADLPARDPYWWSWLFHHLQAAQLRDELRRTALDLRYLAARTAASSPLAVEADLGRAEREWPDDEGLRLLRRSYGQSAHILARCGTLADVQATLCSRLQHLEALRPAAVALTTQLDELHLEVLHPLPDLPHPALIRTLPQLGAVLACATSPDGAAIATAGSDHLIRLWDTRTGSEARTLAGHTSGVRALAFSRDGAWLASGSADRRVRLWDAHSGAPRCLLVGHTESVTDIAIAADASFVVSSSLDGSVRIWDVATATIRHTLARTWGEKYDGWFVSANDQGHWSAVLGCAISPDGRFVASASSDQTLILWDAGSGVAVGVMSGHEAAVNACAFSPDGTLIASAGGDRTVRLWDCATGAMRAVLHRHRQIVTSCVFTPDGTAVVCALADGTVTRVDASGSGAVQVLSGHTDWVNDCDVSLDGRFIVSASSDGTAKVWDARIRADVERPRVHTEWVIGCAGERGGSLVYTASADRSLIRWDVATGLPIGTLAGHDGAVRGCAASPVDDRVASASADKSVIVWDGPSGRLLYTLSGHRDWVNACAFDPSARLLASVSNDRTLRLWDLGTRSRKIAFVAHAHWVNACAFSPDGRHVVSASADGSIRRWSLDVDESMWEAWLSGAKHLSAELATQAMRPLDLVSHTRSVNHCVFAGDGSFMVSASSDSTLGLWDVAGGRPLGVLTGHRGEVIGCDVSPDGARIASVSTDGALKIWDTRARSCLTTVHVDGTLSSCTFTQGGRAVVAAGDMGVYFFSLVGPDQR